MTSLGERITAERDAAKAIVDVARQMAQDWAKDYTDQIRTAVTTYVDGKFADAKTYVDAQVTGTVKTYVDGQIVAAKAAAKTYADGQIAKLVAANSLIPPS